MKFKILGSGASMGVPVIGCSCSVCSSQLPRNKRTRCSALLESAQGHRLLVDCCPDLRSQFLANKIDKIDAIYITHCHFDHVEGLNELRPLNFRTNIPIPLYIHEDHWPSLKQRFDYIFNPNPDYPGAPPAVFEVITFSSYQKLQILDFTLQTLWVNHGNMEVAGLVWKNTAYIPDCNAIPTRDQALLQSIDNFIIDGIWPERITLNHFNIEQAIAAGKQMDAKNIYLTHLSHLVDYQDAQKYESAGASLCYDGMLIPI